MSLQVGRGAVAGLLAILSPLVFATSDEVVARVNGQPIHVAEVLVHLLPAEPHVGVPAPVDPRERALDKVIGVRLLGQEAERRGIEAAGASLEMVEAKRVQTLIKQEMEKQGVRAEAISEEEAEKFYQENANRLNRIASLTLAAIVVEDAELAEELLRRAERADEETFAALALKHSVDEASKAERGRLAVIDDHGGGLDSGISRVALKLREAGAVGLARAADGRYYVLRATEVRIDVEPWSPEVAQRVKNIMLHQKRQAAVETLVEHLRQEAEITIDRAILDRVGEAAAGGVDVLR
jgi:peptidyl-prolyl cis-trans isomerase C